MTLPLAGAKIRASDLATVFPANTDGWSAFTPTWSGTLGNGSLSCNYTKIGRTVVARYALTWGTTTSHAAAAQTFTLPVVAAFAGQGLANAACFDSSASTRFMRQAYMNTTNQIAFISEAGAFVTNTVPMTWATSDSIAFTVVYESAS